MHAKKYSEAIELLSSGAVAMLKHGQVPIRPTMLSILCEMELRNDVRWSVLD